ncbi:MAG: hypothetical protein JXM68_01640 [Sedimentisphaerales bacterium]|nr:hypothetical protein [Sedimentisphaerales bacterium]
MNDAVVLFVYSGSKILHQCTLALRDHCTTITANSLSNDSNIEYGNISVVVADYSTVNNDTTFISKICQNLPDRRVIIVAEEFANLRLNQFNRLDFQLFQEPITVKEVSSYILKQLTTTIKYRRQETTLTKTPYEVVQTLHGIMSLVNPVAYNVGVQLDRFVNVIIDKLEIQDRQEYHSAALLSHIGCIAVEDDVIINSLREQDQDEYIRHMYSMHPELGQKLLENIPMLQDVAKIVGMQNRTYASFSEKESAIVANGAQMIKVAGFMHTNYFRKDLNQKMYNILCENKGIYNKKMLMTFVDYKVIVDDTFVTNLRLKELEPFMILEEPIYSLSGLLLMAGGLELNTMSLERLRKFASSIKEPIKVRCPMRLAKETTT